MSTAVQKRIEAEEENNVHWHRMGVRCWCGYLSVPSRFYEYKDGRQTNSQKQAEDAYLEEMSPVGVPVSDVPTGMSPVSCNVPGCIRKRESGRKTCSACRKKRQRKGD